MSFKVGDWVYINNWGKGTIVSVYPEDCEAVVTFSTGNGGGCLPFGFDELELVQEPMSIKEELLDLCDEMIVLWQKFKEEIQKIPEGNNADLILRWHDYFEEHVDSVVRLNATKRGIEDVEEHLIMQRELGMIL